MDTVLVTGGAGFIGSHYIKHLLQSDPNVHVVNLDKLTYAGNLQNLTEVEANPRYTFVHGDIASRDLLAALFQTYAFTQVVNFAAETHVDRSITAPDPFFQTNVLGTVALLDTAKAAWRTETRSTRFIQISTDEVYGALGASGAFTEETPLNPRNPYAASKASADLAVLSYHSTYGLPVNITRASNNYGPRQFPEKLIPLMICNALQRQPLPVYGDGLQIRDWLYVRDHCTAIELVRREGLPGEVYNVGAGNEWTNIDIVRRILALVSEYSPVQVDESLIAHVQDRPGHDRRYAINSDKLRSALGWQPTMPFDAGLEETVKWYIQNEKWREAHEN